MADSPFRPFETHLDEAKTLIQKQDIEESHQKNKKGKTVTVDEMATLSCKAVQ